MAEQESSAAAADMPYNDAGNPAARKEANGTTPSRTYQPPHRTTVSQVTTPEFLKLANPGPLGLIAFAITTFVVGLLECGAGLPHSNPNGTVGPNQAAFGLVVFMGGTAQVLAGIMQFRIGNTFGTTIHCSYGAFWLSYGMFMLQYLGLEAAYKGDMRAYSFALGIYLIAWCFLTILFFIAALRTNVAILLVFFFLALAFLFLGIAEFTLTEHATASERLNKSGGAFAVICSMCAFYAGASGLMLPETTWVRFPLGEFSSSV
ncbi:uncharacterized protein N7482_010425 [Penicillium canariense]|uniref:Gpr1 family protein n=1 Tax=Penicillium canariense TaxID=189055 RepID=A0A9W9HJS6_9EURO|nr:uncharacterized protein N7482_010425 [Penicillium canariense]KAJ5151173.1 hypothetical protein N7482_010425 [Penicillium canariense]